MITGYRLKHSTPLSDYLQHPSMRSKSSSLKISYKQKELIAFTIYVSTLNVAIDIKWINRVHSRNYENKQMSTTMVFNRVRDCGNNSRFWEYSRIPKLFLLTVLSDKYTVVLETTSAMWSTSSIPSPELERLRIKLPTWHGLIYRTQVSFLLPSHKCCVGAKLTGMKFSNAQERDCCNALQCSELFDDFLC